MRSACNFIAAIATEIRNATLNEASVIIRVGLWSTRAVSLCTFYCEGVQIGP